MSGKVRGIEETMKNIRREFDAIEGKSRAGLLAAGLQVQRLSQARTPVEFGNLKASAYTRKVPEDQNAVEVGYEASYAVYVHENMEQKLKGEPRPSGLGNYWGPAGQPKFLESAVIDMQDEIVTTVAAYTKRNTGTS